VNLRDSVRKDPLLSTAASGASDRKQLSRLRLFVGGVFCSRARIDLESHGPRRPVRVQALSVRGIDTVDVGVLVSGISYAVVSWSTKPVPAKNLERFFGEETRPITRV